MQGKIQFSGKLFSNFQLSERVPIYYFYRRLKQELDLDFYIKRPVITIAVRVSQALILLFSSS
ncbi:MAG: hypothetical protein DWQ48_07450 [Bacteroidetes bacterium]|nr:MAG: hypothetical protein DWQ48_07450 [Bacteroidota bacterium]